MEAQRRESLRQAAIRRYQDPEQRRMVAEQNRRRGAAMGAEERKAAGERLRLVNQALPKAAFGMSHDSSEYKIWISMNQRCSNQKTKQYKDYGGRGIRVHPDWTGPGGFAKWFEHVGARPSSQHTIGRIDNDKNYEPGNVRWETRHEQMANFRRNHNVTIGGVTLHITEWARRIGVTAPAFAARIKRGWPEERLLEPPLHGSRRAP
jgi:hypothetical protein